MSRRILFSLALILCLLVPGWAQQPVTGQLSNNGQAAAANRIGTLPCIIQTDPANGSASTQGRDGAVNCGTVKDWSPAFARETTPVPAGQACKLMS